ncbi:MAG: FAD-dependent oxidoreductase [Chloroflexi bacterium]|nr:FAD-dependent oxidoreductase [Chloroflexota bacterium]
MATSWDFDTDVVVVGGGACGLLAAVHAATHAGGVDVVLLEKNERWDCNAELASGTLQAAGTRLQQAADIDDSPEIMYGDIMRKNHGRSDPAVTMALCRQSAEMVHWFIDHLGLPLVLATEIRRIGHTRMRMHHRARAARALGRVAQRGVRRQHTWTWPRHRRPGAGHRRARGSRRPGAAHQVQARRAGHRRLRREQGDAGALHSRDARCPIRRCAGQYRRRHPLGHGGRGRRRAHRGVSGSGLCPSDLRNAHQPRRRHQRRYRREPVG